MRQLLLLSASAMLLASLGVGAAHAETTVKTGGYIKFQAGFFDNDDADVVIPQPNKRETRLEARLVFQVEGSSDSGLEYGARVNLVANSNSSYDNTEEAFVYIGTDPSKGGWGQLRLGDQLGAASELTVAAPVVGNGQIKSDFYYFAAPYASVLGAGGGGSSVGRGPLLTPYNLDEDFSTRITYFTPSFAGFRLGASYAPELSDGGENTVLSSQAGGNDLVEDAYEVAINYSGGIDAVQIDANISYVGGSGKKNAVGPANADLSGLQAGLALGYRGFSIGGGYVSQDDYLYLGVPAKDVNEYNIGLSYENGPFGIGASYVYTEASRFLNTNGDLKSNLVSGGGVYRLDRGLTIGADVTYYDLDFPAGTIAGQPAFSASGLQLLLQTGLNF